MDRFLQMQTFCSVVDAGSFVAAADQLGLSKAAVSRHVSELESRLGVRLLQRTTRRLSLTEEGRLFHARASELLAGIEEAEAELDSRRSTAHGLLRINVPVTFGIRHLAPLWGGFRALHPQVQLEITLVDRQVDLIEEGYDLAIRIASLPASSLISRRLTSTRLILCASPAYLQQHGSPQTPQELTEHSIIGYSLLASGNDWHLQGPQGSLTITTRPQLISNNGDTCRALLLNGQGIGLQPDFLVGEDLRAGQLVEPLPGWSGGELGIHAVYPSRKHVPVKVRALLDYLSQQFAERAPF